MPTFSKVSHISFSARDAEASAKWWTEVLDMAEIDRVEGQGWRGVLLMHPATAPVIEFQQHDANHGEAFDPRRTGFDHLGLKVDDRAALVEWEEHFDRLGVTHSPIADRE